jgi:hypothetical protein
MRGMCSAETCLIWRQRQCQGVVTLQLCTAALRRHEHLVLVVKELAGKALGDAKLTEGRSDRAKGKLQSAIGGLKDTLRKK